MSKVEQKPYVIYLAEIIYKSIVDIKKKNPDISNIDAIEGFIGTVTYNNISSGKFHDNWFEYLENNNFIDKDSFVKDVIDTDGYGMLSSYDGNYDVRTVKGNEYYVMRID